MKTRFLTAAGFLLLWLILPLPAAALDVEPSITLGEIYTSNVNLDPSGQEESEWVTRVAPAISIGYQGSRLDLQLDYLLEALFYANVSDRNEVYNQLNSSALFDLIGEDLQLRANASISQVNVSPTEPVTSSNVNTTGNRANATTWNVGPQWQHGIFSGSQIDGFATVGNVNYDDPVTQDVDTTRGRVSVHTDGSDNPTVTYDLSYEYDRLEYQNTGDTTVQTTYLQLGYNLNDNWQVFGLVGYDDDSVNNFSRSESRWETGVGGNFTNDSFRAAFGHRYFGSTYSFNWDHVGTSASYGLSYSESPSTTDLTALREIPTDPNADPSVPPPDPGINRPGNPTAYVRKRADADASWSLYHSTLSINVFWEDREDQVIVTNTGTPPTGLNNESSYGVDTTFEWELGSRSTANFSAGWRHREYNDLPDVVTTDPIPTTDDELYSIQAGLDYELGLRTTLAFQTGYRSRQSASTSSDGVPPPTSGSASDYDEYWASVQLVRTF